MNVIGHFMTVTKHRHQVFRHCVKCGIPWRGLVHDLSKYSLEEFYYGAKFYTGTQSPHAGEREAYGFSHAWMHHKGRNKHHFEYWSDYGLVGKEVRVIPVRIPLKYVIEMFCDRVAASKIYLRDKYTDASAYQYFDKGRPGYNINPETAAFLESLLVMLRDKGEKETFAYIRRCLRNKDIY